MNECIITQDVSAWWLCRRALALSTKHISITCNAVVGGKRTEGGTKRGTQALAPSCGVTGRKPLKRRA